MHVQLHVQGLHTNQPRVRVVQIELVQLVKPERIVQMVLKQHVKLDTIVQVDQHGHNATLVTAVQPDQEASQNAASQLHRHRRIAVTR